METTFLFAILTVCLVGVTFHAWRLGNEKRDVVLLGIEVDRGSAERENLKRAQVEGSSHGGPGVRSGDDGAAGFEFVLQRFEFGSTSHQTREVVDRDLMLRK